MATKCFGGSDDSAPCESLWEFSSCALTSDLSWSGVEGVLRATAMDSHLKFVEKNPQKFRFLSFKHFVGSKVLSIR